MTKHSQGLILALSALVLVASCVPPLVASDRANVRRYATVEATEGLAPGKLTSRTGGLSGTPQTLDHVMPVSTSTPAPRVAVSADVSNASDEDNAGQVLGLTAGVLAAIVLIAGAIGLIGLVWHH